MVQYLLSSIRHGGLRNIVHRFPEAGHSFLPCDRSFGVFEKEKRKHDRIYLPSQYGTLLKKTSRQFKLVEVSQLMFLDFLQHFRTLFKNSATVKGTKFMVSKYRLFQYSSEYPFEVACCELASGTHFTKFMILKPGVTTITMPTKSLYDRQLTIKEKKHKDVMKLATSYVPPSDMWFYNQLTPEAQNNDCQTSETDEG